MFLLREICGTLERHNILMLLGRLFKAGHSQRHLDDDGPWMIKIVENLETRRRYQGMGEGAIYDKGEETPWNSHSCWNFMNPIAFLR